ncbi:MAG TPA: hypothetical protein PLQ93_11875 [Bacteroidia bacterium]|nr:hypothetical protein [Bacteroidia bacterium]
MLLRHCAILILLSCFSLSAQEANCENSFMHDTLSIPEKVPLMHGEALKVTLKNQSVVELFAEERKRFFVRLYVTENFYFNKIDVLQVESGKWTYPVKNCKQYKINKTTGMYVFEVQKNYLVTLRDEGITGLVFAGAKTDFTRSDGQQTRKMCRCFYETMFGKQ